MAKIAPLPDDVVRSVPIPTFRKAELKIKIKSLAAEAVLIRKDESKALAKSRTAPDETHREWHKTTYKSLNDHRRGIVRFEARCAQLAYAFLLGKPHKLAEPKCKTSYWAYPLVENVAKTASRFTKTAVDSSTVHKWFYA